MRSILWPNRFLVTPRFANCCKYRFTNVHVLNLAWITHQQIRLQTKGRGSAIALFDSTPQTLWGDLSLLLSFFFRFRFTIQLFGFWPVSNQIQFRAEMEPTPKVNFVKKTTGKTYLLPPRKEETFQSMFDRTWFNLLFWLIGSSQVSPQLCVYLTWQQRKGKIDSTILTPFVSKLPAVSCVNNSNKVLGNRSPPAFTFFCIGSKVREIYWLIHTTCRAKNKDSALSGSFDRFIARTLVDPLDFPSSDLFTSKLFPRPLSWIQIFATLV